MRRAVRRGPAAVLGVAAAALALAAAPRLIALGYGLPHVYNADESYVLDMAASLLGGLRPFSFRYPTLWPELLAAFSALDPGGFYLIARALAAFSQLGALVVVALCERDGDARRWPFGAAALAASPILVELAHAAKPDSLMLLLAAASCAAALRHQKGGSRGWLLASAFLGGLACSTQYTAAPAVLIAPLAWLLCEEGPGPFSWLVQAALAAAFGFVVATPYALIDHARFIASWSDYADLGRLRPHDAAETARLVARNLWCFGGEGSPAGAAAALGFILGLRRGAKRAVMLALPVAAYAALLSTNFDGRAPRQLLGAYPALALLAGEGFAWLGGRKALRRGLVAALALAPGIVLCWRFDADLLRPDTRAQATDWLRTNVPEGASVLLDQPHAGPFTAARRPGGGWRVYRIQRAPGDEEFLDVRSGLDVVRAARIEWVVTSSFGADPRRARELSTFFSELASQATLVREFPSKPGKTAGPWLRIFRLRR